METQRVKCVKHDKINEIICKTCNSLLCSRCLSEHAVDAGHAPKFIHILHYSPSEVLPKIDSLIAEAKGKQAQIEQDVKDIHSSLAPIMPKLTEIITIQEKKFQNLQKMLKQLKVFSQHTSKGSFGDVMIKGLQSDKKNCEKAMSDKNPELALKIALKVQAEALINQISVSPSDLVKQMEIDIKKLDELKLYEQALIAASMMLTKCASLRMMHTDFNWKVDRKMLSSKLTLSEDGLTLGNSASNGYPGAVGTMPFIDGGMYAFRVTPQSLQCSNKEGFGIIEADKWKAAHKKDSVTPLVHDDMIGFLYSNTAKNMKSDTIESMKMDQKYYVRVNLVDYNVNITGPGLSLHADLKSGTEYYPCFSLGCSSNKLLIKPLENYDAVDES